MTEEKPPNQLAINQTEKELLLIRIWEQVLGIQGIGIHDHFFRLGGDSVKAIQLSARLYKHGYDLKLKDLFNFPNIRDLSRQIFPLGRSIRQGVVHGEGPFTPIQHWFSSYIQTDPHYYNQSIILFRREGFKESILRQVLKALCTHHDALRSVIDLRKPCFHIRPPDDRMYAYRILYPTTSSQDDPLVREAMQWAQSTFDLENGPLMKVVLFKTEQGDHLLWVIHHMVIDGVSWRILLEDFIAAYESLYRKMPIQLPPKTDSYLRWARELNRFAQGEWAAREISYWEQLCSQHKALSLQPDPRLKTQPLKRKELVCKLTQTETRQLLTEASAAFRTEINDLLIVALGLAVQPLSPETSFTIWLEGHGREPIMQDMNITRTVGWFTSEYPFLVELPQTKNLGRYIRQIKEKLRRVPHKGIGYGILRYICPQQAPPLVKTLQADIGFNYLGSFDTEIQGEVFETSSWDTGKSISSRISLPYAIEIIGMVLENQLSIQLRYQPHLCSESFAQALMLNYQRQIKALIRFCIEQKSSIPSPGDFGDLWLNLEEFDHIRQHVEGLSGVPTISQLYPLTGMQHAMYLPYILQKGSDIYIEQVSMGIQGAIDITACRQLIRQLVERHDVLRCIFVHSGLRKPYQIILDKANPEVELKSIAHLSPIQQQEFLDTFVLFDRQRGFDLAKDCLLRFTLFQLGENSFRAIWTHHHILLDGWSTSILIEEFLSMYWGWLENKPSVLDPSLSFSRFDEWLKNRDHEQASHYWQSYLAEHPPAYTFFPAKTEMKSKASIGAGMVLEIPQQLLLNIQELLNSRSITVSTLVHAVWGILLQKYCQQSDIIIGTLVSGRPPELSGIERAVGLFINTLPLRIQVSSTTSFIEILNRMQQDVLERQPYEFLPLADIQACLGKQRLFDTFVVFENYPIEHQLETMSPRSSQLFEIEDVQLIHHIDYPLFLSAYAGEKHLKLVVNYHKNTEIEEKIIRLGNNFIQLLEALIQYPGKPVELIGLGEMPLLAAGEELVKNDLEPPPAFHPDEGEFLF